MTIVPDIQLLLQGQIISVLRSEKHSAPPEGQDRENGKKMVGKSRMSEIGT